jgi:penicillin-binding protein-related factor A (putative recombinase)
MNESDCSQAFIKKQKEKYGNSIYIEKVIKQSKSDPDIFCIYNGMPLFMEAKLINSISYKNLYPFKELQLDTLAIYANVKAISIGLLYMNKEVRYLMHYDLKEYLCKEDWDKAKIFDLDELWNEWKEGINL